MMCEGCYRKFGSPKIINDKTLIAAALIGSVYSYSLVGGNLHIVLDDWNVEDESIQWCLSNSILNNSHEASVIDLQTEKLLAEYLLTMTESERASSLAIVFGMIKEGTIK